MSRCKSIAARMGLGVFVCALVLAAVAVLRMPLPPQLVFGQVIGGDHAALRASLRAEPGAVGWRDSLGYTPLHWAVAMNDRAAAEMLLDAGADPNARDLRGRTPLHLIAASPRCGDGLLRALLARGAAVDPADARGATPLQLAETLARPDLADVLLASGAAAAKPAPAPSPAGAEPPTAIAAAADAATTNATTSATTPDRPLLPRRRWALRRWAALRARPRLHAPPLYPLLRDPRPPQPVLN